MNSNANSADALVERLAEVAAAIERSGQRVGRSAQSIMGDAVSQGERAASREWSALKRDLAELAEHADLDALPEVRALVERMRESIGSVSATLDGAAEQARSRAQAGISQIDGYAHDAPWKTAGVAALAGIAIGLMITRR